MLTESAAKKFFGNIDPIGQTLKINGQQQATITGIMRDIPYNSHLRMSMLFSMSTLISPGANWNDNWKRFGFYTYLLLKPGASPAKLNAKLPAFIKSHINQSQLNYTLSLEPLEKVYLYGKPRGHRTGSSESGSISNIYIFAVVAAFVLFIACFNFINLTTAFSLKRAREIGVRKVLGATRHQLSRQFFMDALFVCLVAYCLALAMAALLLPEFNRIAGTIIAENIFTHSVYLADMLLIAITVGLLSGVYPALFLSGFKPVQTLKGKPGPVSGGLQLRKALVVLQFCISIILIISTAIVYTQLDFMQNHGLGFEKDHRLVIDYEFNDRINRQPQLAKQELSGLPGVTGATFSSGIPGTPNDRFTTYLFDDQGRQQELQADSYFIDGDFLKQYGIKLIAGRNIDSQFAGDDKAMLVNLALVKKMGFKNAQEAIGKRFKQFATEGSIVGVVEDFHYHSSLELVQPLVLRPATGFFTCLTLNVRSNNVQQTISQVERRWRQIFPDVPLVYYFADEAYNKQYRAQSRFEQLFICFSVLAILISCLGLAGLSAFTAAQRKKEIGIRKVLGATAAGIAAVLAKDFMKLVFIAVLIASPVAWWAMTVWLREFAYRINMSWWVFVLSGAAALIIGLATVSFQSVQAALVNPVKSLKDN